MNVVINFIKFILSYVLCLYYNCGVLLFFIYKFITKFYTRFWITKDHSIPPDCLKNSDYGEHKYVTINGLKLHYVEKGDSTKPLMLFIHGFPEFWYSWRYQIKEFSTDYWTVALDLRGFGDSDKPSNVSDYKIDNITSDIKEFILKLGKDKCILIGHDWGAVIGFSFITKYVDMIDKYVMMGAPSMEVIGKTIANDWEQFKKSWYIFFFQMPKIPEFICSLNDYDNLKSIGSGKISERFTKEDLEAYKYMFSRKGALTSSINYYRANVNFFYNNKTIKLTKNLPGLFIMGEKDLYISLKSGYILQKIYKNLDYKIVSNANHFVQQDAPDKVNEVIREFLVANK